MITDRVLQRFGKQEGSKGFWQALHVDVPLLLALLLLLGSGLVILYSASSQSIPVIQQQLTRIGFAFLIMLFFAQISPSTYQRWAPFLYCLGVILLICVVIMGRIGNGAQRWLHFGFFRFQPSEMMKLVLPMFLASHFHRIHLPLTFKSIFLAVIVIAIPSFLTARQPDLSTASILLIAGGSVLLLAGISWRLIGGIVVLFTLATPVLWYVLHDYQRQRVLTFINPERDPLGNGYHIIQSKIAIGSGGLFGKGWLNGSQSHLHFLPENSTDFIFAVCGEEFGFAGSVILIILFMAVISRGLYITIRAQDTFTRLLAGSLTLTFFCSFFINMCMVTGILPVMGLPLPLISYGGSSMVTLMASFGILMSIQTHRKLLTT